MVKDLLERTPRRRSARWITSSCDQKTTGTDLLQQLMVGTSWQRCRWLGKTVRRLRQVLSRMNRIGYSLRVKKISTGTWQPTHCMPCRCHYCHTSMSVWIYVAHHGKNNASNALDVPSAVQRGTSSACDESSRFVCPVHADRHETSSVSLVQRQRRCDGRIRVQLKPWNNE